MHDRDRTQGPLDPGYTPLFLKLLSWKPGDIQWERAPQFRKYPEDFYLLVWTSCALLPHYRDKLRARASVPQKISTRGQHVPRLTYLLVPIAAWRRDACSWIQALLRAEAAVRPHWVSL
eukprot:5442303-Pyramimonas_sp.AAC.1